MFSHKWRLFYKLSYIVYNSKSTFLNTPSLCTLPIPLGLKTKDKPRKNQGRTKERPKNSKTQKSTFVKIAISFPSLIPCLIPPTDDRENSDSTPCLQKVTFLKIDILKRLPPFLKKLSPFLKRLTYVLKRFLVFVY